MIRLKRILLFSCIGLFGISWGTNAQNLQAEHIEQQVEQYLKNKKNRGLVIGIIQGDEISIKGYGKNTKKQKTPPNERTVFEIGALTQVFTATLMMQQQQLGRLDISDLVSNYLPEHIVLPKFHEQLCTEIILPNIPGQTPPLVSRRIVYCAPAPSAEDICISFCDLPTHVSGMSNSFYKKYTWNPLKEVKSPKKPYATISQNDFYHRLKRHDLYKPPGHQFYYSTIGMAVLGDALAHLNQTTFAQLLENDLLNPLQLKDTRFDLSPAQWKRMAQGHSAKGKKVLPTQLDAFAPAAGLKSTAHDLVRFVQANLHSNYKGLQQVFDEVHQSRIETGKEKLGRPTWMAYGWLVSTLNESSNQPVVWHNGGTNGFRVFVGFVKDTQTGVVILSNSANSVDELGFDILEILD